VIDREVSSLRDSHPALTVETTVPDDLRVVADGLLHQLFLNLLTNAVAHNDPETLTVTIDAASNGELAEITVRDDGSGIPEEIEETLFELGKKGPGSSGDGLGLYLVSRLVDLYGGTVAPAESPSGGAQFDITLPAAD
jgi:signal transduction histidine kinase